MNAVVITLAILLYLLAAGLLMKRLASGIEARASTKHVAVLSGLIAATLHALAVYDGVLLDQGLNLSFFLALSFTSWMGQHLSC